MAMTNPASMSTEAAVASDVAWEFTDSTMGDSYGAPLAIKTAKYGWVVALPSGYDNSDGNGYLYFVNPKTGALRMDQFLTPFVSHQRQVGKARPSTTRQSRPCVCCLPDPGEDVGESGDVRAPAHDSARNDLVIFESTEDDGALREEFGQEQSLRLVVVAPGLLPETQTIEVSDLGPIRGDVPSLPRAGR